MKKWLNWRTICIVYIPLLIILKIFFSPTYTLMNKNISIQSLKNNEYMLWEEKEMKKHPDYDNLAIYIDINMKTLELVNLDNNSVLKRYLIATGKTKTPSPIGNWTITEKARWGKGFGTRWMGLNVPWGKYGIHGTNNPSSIGRPASHGCIRMQNKDVEDLYRYVKVGTPVNILGGTFGPFGNGFKVLVPGDRGADVFEVQKRMKRMGYYPGYIDGIYGEGMKAYVIKFRKDTGLSLTHNIDLEFYKALNIYLFE